MSNLLKPIFAVIAASAALWLAAAPAQAAEVCTGQTPAAGEVVRGPVLHVEDADTLCVALGATPDTWVRLTLADAPKTGGMQRAAIDQSNDNPRGTLMAVAFSQNVVCDVLEDSKAVCRVGDQSVGALLKQPAAWVAGRDWR